MTDRQVRKFNPGTLQSDEEVIRQFVVRNRELDIVLEVLGGNLDSPSCQHALVVGPRGQGKTMLLARLAAELRGDGELSRRLFPVRFMEDSQEIFNLADFWLDTLFHLEGESARHDPAFAQELRGTHAALTARWREETLEKQALAAVLDAADRLGKKLVLMVENLQALWRNVDDDFGWKLRGVLQSEPQIMLVASATSRFKGLDDAEQPFFEMFRIVGLEPLDTDECRRLWQVVSGDEVTGREIRPLEILTGGSPRLLVIVSGLGRHLSLRRLMEELVRLIDDHTEYFRGHLETLGKTERRVYLAVMDLWQPSSTGEISARARMDVRTVSTMLGRLVERGAVIAEGSGRKRMYRVAERLYSIYYKLRREREEADVIANLIRFMAVFYSRDELIGMSGKLEDLEGRAESLVKEGKAGFTWRALCESAIALKQLGRNSEALQSFRSAYAAFLPGNPTAMGEMLQAVPDLIAAGLMSQELVEILVSDRTKADTLRPLVVALRQHAGEAVREPVEVLEVAADIRHRIEEGEERNLKKCDTAPGTIHRRRTTCQSGPDP